MARLVSHLKRNAPAPLHYTKDFDLFGIDDFAVELEAYATALATKLRNDNFDHVKSSYADFHADKHEGAHQTVKQSVKVNEKSDEGKGRPETSSVDWTPTVVKDLDSNSDEFWNS